MKKIIFLLLTLIPLNMFAQRVELNEIDETGKRTIETETRVMYIDQSIFLCQLFYTEQAGLEEFFLVFVASDQASRWECKSGQQILLKDAKGKVHAIEFRGSSKSELSRSTSGRGLAYTTYTLIALTKEQALIFQEGLTKIRLSYTYTDSGQTDLKDFNIPEDMTGHLKKAYKNIIKTIPLPADVDKSVF